MPGWGEVAGLGGALCWGLTSLVVRHRCTRANPFLLSALTLAMASLMAGLVLLLPLALGQYHPMLGPRPLLGAALLSASVLLSFAVGNPAYFLAMRWLGVARALPMSLAQPPLAAGLA